MRLATSDRLLRIQEMQRMLRHYIEMEFGFAPISSMGHLHVDKEQRQ